MVLCSCGLGLLVKFRGLDEAYEGLKCLQGLPGLTNVTARLSRVQDVSEVILGAL